MQGTGAGSRGFGVVFLMARGEDEGVCLLGFSCVWSVRLGGAGFCPKCGKQTERRFLDGCILAANISSMCQTSLSKFQHADVDFSQKPQIFLCF